MEGLYPKCFMCRAATRPSPPLFPGPATMSTLPGKHKQIGLTPNAHTTAHTQGGKGTGGKCEGRGGGREHREVYVDRVGSGSAGRGDWGRTRARCINRRPHQPPPWSSSGLGERERVGGGGGAREPRELHQLVEREPRLLHQFDVNGDGLGLREVLEPAAAAARAPGGHGGRRGRGCHGDAASVQQRRRAVYPQKLRTPRTPRSPHANQEVL